MQIAIISDIHDNLANLEKCLTWCRQNKVSKIICCGDLTNLDTVSYLAHNFLGEIFLVAGNAEIYEEFKLNKFKNINYCGEVGYKTIDNLKIGFYHKPKTLKKIQELSLLNLDFIFYGHTHKPWLEKNNNLIIANPGTLAGTFSQATFAILDTSTKNLTLKRVADL
jgi:hypothetical protein